MKTKLIRRGDLILLGSLLLTALLVGELFLLFAPAGKTAVVTLDGQEIARLPMSKDGDYKLNDTHTLVIRDGSVTVTEAPCPDQICVHHVAVSRQGETIVCLPYRLVVTVEGGTSP